MIKQIIIQGDDWGYSKESNAVKVRDGLYVQQGAGGKLFCIITSFCPGDP